MKLTVPTLAFALAACTSSQTSQTKEPAKEAAKEPVTHTDAVAYYAGGCFWGVEHFMEKLDGVGEVDSGYMGGPGDAPTYKDVSTGTSGHLEAVRVTYNSSKISYGEITKRFFEIHDPTQADGQGPDLGQQYLSAVFYASPKERTDAQELIDILIERDYKVVTELREVATFWPAEDYHQDYYAKNGKQPYCHSPVRRFGSD